MTIDKAIVLSAGKGSRLLPLTEDTPKCLIDCSGRTLLDWQLDALFAGGIEDVVVVTGFRADKVDAIVARRRAAGQRVATLFNPFYHVADNLGSVWLARAELERDCAVLNGDTLIAADIVRLLRARAAADAVTVAIAEKPFYDSDDMKVLRAGDRLLRIGKKLTDYDAESIGFLGFRGQGRAAFVAAVEAAMHGPEGTTSWYLKVIDTLAPAGAVTTLPIGDLACAEVDFPADLAPARALTARWRAAGGV